MAASSFAQKESGTLLSRLLLVTELTNSENIHEALFILEKAFASFKAAGIKKSEISKVLADAEKGEAEVQVSFSVAKQKDKSIIYSVRLEINGKESVVTLRLANDSTELSLHKDGKLKELMFEKNGKIEQKIYG